MKTLFLDFDGVLHPTLAAPSERFASAGMLADTLSGYECEIVISSSWRFQLEFGELLRVLPASLAQRVVGVTGAAVIGRYARHEEILAWLLAFGERDWRALDDSKVEFPVPCPQLIHCNGSYGIRKQEAAALSAWLER